MLRLKLVVFLIVSVLVFASCLSDEEESDDQPATLTPTTESAAEPTATTEPDEGSDLSPTPEEESDPTEADDPPAPTATEATEDPAATETPTEEGEATQEPTAEPDPTEPPVALDDLSIEISEVATGLVQPIAMSVALEDSSRIFVLERPGRIRVIVDGELQQEPFLDLTDRVGSTSPEQGLLGLAFHPEFAENGQFFVNYTNQNGDTVISRFRATDDLSAGDPESESDILQLEQPAGNHNGGNLLFGPDGNLWIGTGDGGGSGDQYENAQNGQTLLGAMLRIDVSSADPYAIPPDNPFMDNPDVLDEIWAIGLRNPWRYSFDRMTGDLYIADVGQNQWEEVNRSTADANGFPPGGENFGWPILEGTHCYQSEDCSTEGLTMPIHEYSQDEGGCSITGGYVYRGEANPDLVGTYFFTDYCSGNVWGLRADGEEVETALIAEYPGSLFASFGEDNNGELYLIDANGTLYSISQAG